MGNSWPSREVQGRVEGTLHRQRRPGCRWLGVSAYQIRWTKERDTQSFVSGEMMVSAFRKKIP